MTSNDPGEAVVALCGGVGGAKLAQGLAAALDPPTLTIIVNTGDDFEHLGLTLCPDIDTVLYTLAGLHDKERGWGRANETWNFMTAVAEVGAETWFQLGDKDLATHLRRSDLLRSGKSLSEVTAMLATAFGVNHRIVPMADEAVRTIVNTDDGELPFQRYFVERCCEPRVNSIRFAGAGNAQVATGAADALNAAHRAIVICPSNPYLSVDPLLAVPGMADLLKNSDAPVIAVSPIVDGEAVKGPTAKIMRELGLAVNSLTIARHYQNLIDGLIIDGSDAALQPDIEALGIKVQVSATLMKNADDKLRLASETLQFAGSLGSDC